MVVNVPTFVANGNPLDKYTNVTIAMKKVVGIDVRYGISQTLCWKLYHNWGNNDILNAIEDIVSKTSEYFKTVSNIKDFLPDIVRYIIFRISPLVL